MKQKPSFVFLYYSLFQCALGMFTTDSLIGVTLTPTTAFVSLILIENISWSATMMPQFITEAIEVHGTHFNSQCYFRDEGILSVFSLIFEIT